MIKGQIVDIREDGTALIRAQIDVGLYVHRKVKEVYVEPIDSRPLSDKQRRMCYAMIKAIADWSGSSSEDIKQAFKMEFWAEHVDTLADKIFSLSDAPMSLVAEFQRFLVRFIIENDVPLKFALREYADDIGYYTFMCVLHKKCAVCGKRAAKLVFLNGMTAAEPEVISLCAAHGAELEELGKRDFLGRYHFEGGIAADKTICKLYGVKAK